MIAEFHARALAAIPDVTVTAVLGRDQEKTTAFANKHGAQPYTDTDAFFRHTPLDVVTICTPSGAHLAPALAAARHGKHVICEKPLEVSLPRIDDMIAACNTADVTLAGIFPRRFNPATRHLKEAIDAGRFGRIVSADAYVKWWRTQAYYDSGAWRGTWALDGGGALMNQAIHTIDLLLHLMGDVDTVHAQTMCAAHTDIEVEDTATAMLRFKNSAFGVIQASTACWSENGHAAEIHIMGDRGSAILTDDKFRVWEFQDPEPQDSELRAQFGLAAQAQAAGAADPAAIDFRWHQHNFEDAIRAIRTRTSPHVDGIEARRAVALIRAIYDSAAADGAKITLP